MAISITCPGCQAAFEVPESLAGKTIRCTSCKTQLSVAAAKAKGAFGTAKAPLSLDDDDAAPVARSSPAANGKATAAKSVARAAVAVVDDDDDDDAPKKKTSPNKPASKSGPALKGAPKKRRDDDDDDDDDDDRPRRKKKSGGGNGPMIALIGGGVVCLAAIVGLCVWLLGGDDSKDSAKSDGSTTNSTPASMQPPPGGGSAGGPPGGFGSGSGGGRPPGAGGSAGGRPPGAGGSAGGPPPGFGPGTGGPPGGLTPMRPGTGGAGGGMGPGGGRPPMGGSASGPPPGFGGPQAGSGMGPGDTETQGQGSGGPPPNATRPPAGGGSGSGPPPGFGPGGGPPPNATRPPAGGGSGSGPPPGFGPGGGMGPGAGGARPPGPLGPPGPGGGLGRPPGRGGPGLGGPGGFSGGQSDPNAPPIGANADGYLKAEIETFFAGAFDPEKKEFFSFSSTPNRSTMATTLYRYNVADNFNRMGSFKVHHFVSRAVIDPAKGLLYAATIHRATPATVGSQTMDQTTGVGDVVVYDLNAIRDDKVKDGGDLKPIHTFGMAKKICGLELSQDGKSLFIVTNVVSGKSHKSYLNVFDTETRKLANPPTALEAPAWTASRSPDGKYLLIVDEVVDQRSKTAKTAPTISFLRVYDMASGKKIKDRSLQGIGNDLAATTNGQYVAAVMAGGGLKLVLANETNNTRDLELGFGWKAAAKPGYVEYSPDGKHLYVSGHPYLSGSYPQQQGQQAYSPGLDVYDVVDADSPTGLKKTASIRTAGKEMVGGHFLVSPEGEYLVFQTGVVVEAAKIGGNNGESNAVGGGFPGRGGAGVGAAGGEGMGEATPPGGAPVPGGGMPPGGGGGRPPKPGVSAPGLGGAPMGNGGGAPPPLTPMRPSGAGAGGGGPGGAPAGGAPPPLTPLKPNSGGGGGGNPGKPGGSGM